MRRAAELQTEAGADLDMPGGHSQREVERIGLELGLEPAFIERAVAEHREREIDGGQTRWLGAPPRYEIERVVEGELSEDTWEAVVHELNAEYHQAISGETTRGIRTWVWQHDLGSVRLLALSKDRKVRLRFIAHIDDGISTGLILTVIAMFGLSAGAWAHDLLRPWTSAALTLGVWGLGAFWFRTAVAKWFRRDKMKSSDLVDLLVSIVEHERTERDFEPVELTAEGHQGLHQRLS